MILRSSHTVALSGLSVLKSLTEENPDLKVVIGWDPPLPVHGRLVYKDGKPAPGLRLQTWSRDSRRLHTAVSDADGEFGFSPQLCAKGELSLTLASRGFLFESGDSSSSWTQFVPGDNARQITVLRSAILSGQVVDESGKAIPGERYHDEFRVQVGAKLVIKIP